MILRTLLVGALSVGALAAPAQAAASAPKAAAVKWQDCPAYSDDVLRSFGLPEKEFPRWRRLYARTECGTLAVPQNYADPDGKQITVAFTRLKAADQAHRLGSLAVNPGGPGGSGYLMPIDLVMSGMKLDERYDLIGLDPRGTGYSTKAACKPPEQKEPEPGPVTEEQARQVYAATVAANKACGASDPGLIGQITTANAARDLDRIRAALGERKLAFLGVSWGTWFGAVYRSLFPQNVQRMWLDSVAIPVPRMDVFTDVRAGAADGIFQRLAAWIAERDATYGFGDTKAEVVAALTRLRERYDEHPVTFTDIDFTVDGRRIAEAASQPSPAWKDVAQVLKELVDATGPEAPPTLKKLAGGGPGGPPPAGAPERGNKTANVAYFCNEDLGSRTFESAWRAYQERLRRYPVTGEDSAFVPQCAGWPLPVQETRLRRGGGSLMLSGHLHESPSPYQWTLDMRAAVGGTVVTVDDDVHGSALHTPGCVSKIVAYFETGRRTRTCPGVPVPAGS
ncbi:alpha/beta hydrolase [Actinomadura sp. ATCC 31491]|uniref:Alpha/beta hydrolase n=1 Tax=Actinomadura luzonensis TaxID=2805427 RepID=A0ABT0GB91_9ACTN|nr:alpha/beta fold hydrolase [Actinomadura luzonensis]MCK2221859.1 alpha/beta hydrolase [Actinomadura luzonensis]